MKPLKYPSTPHLPFSPTVQKDDIVMSNCSHFTNRKVVVTEKLDGGNCQLFQGKVYARTTSKPSTHDSFNVIKSYYPQFAYKQPQNIALYGENMCAMHSIEYNRIGTRALFYLFAVLKNMDRWLSWKNVKKYAGRYGLLHAPVLFEGTFKSNEEMKKWMDNRMKENSSISSSVGPEGFVIRIAEGFDMKDFEMSIGKYVRPNHIQTDSSWRGKWKKQLYFDGEEAEGEN